MKVNMIILEGKKNKRWRLGCVCDVDVGECCGRNEVECGKKFKSKRS